MVVGVNRGEALTRSWLGSSFFAERCFHSENTEPPMISVYESLLTLIWSVSSRKIRTFSQDVSEVWGVKSVVVKITAAGGNARMSISSHEKRIDSSSE